VLSVVVGMTRQAQFLCDPLSAVEMDVMRKVMKK
jgi:hypothetical protein